MAYTGGTNGYAAGAESNSSALDYALETTYNTPPTGAYQALRYTDFSLDVNETEAQPDEINDVPEMAESVLTGRTTQGSLSGIMSVVTYEDMLAGIMGADWSANAVSMGNPGSDVLHASDTSFMDGVDCLQTADVTSAKKFPAAGNLIISDPDCGFVINVPYTKIDTVSVPNSAVFVFGNGMLNSAAPLLKQCYGVMGTGSVKLGANSTYFIPSILNGKLGKAFTFRQKLANNWRLFSGTMVNQVQITLQKSQPATVTIDLLGSDMAVSTSDISSSVTPRTATPLIDTVEGFMGCSIFGNAPAGCIQSATITLSRDSSGQDTGMGHVGACGIRFGSFKAAMEITYFFKDYQQFTDWKNGKTGPVTVGVQGRDGVGYQFTVLNGVIRNPKAPISGKNSTVVATVSVTANPIPGGGTFAITRVSS
ncbi:phage tail tube protein [Acetobacter sp. A11-2]|uniref:phage tail tube protein n=1 Tax=Acetobacter sp. A11-2 TaxID=3157859 RepID=UPI0032F07554